MIKRNELRIGNLVHDIYEGRTVVLDIDRIYHALVNPKLFSPIPIDAFHLTQFGFVNTDGRNFGLHFTVDDSGKYYLEMNVTDKILYLKADFQDDLPLPKAIKTVHQLQNIYFALTGTELIILKPVN